MFARLHTQTGQAALIVTIVVATIFIRLGNWQLNRAAEKVQIASVSTAAAARPVRQWSDKLELSEELYRRFKLVGHFDFERQFLLDNKIFQGRVGYEILTPFQPQSSPTDVVLVNRGWVPANPNRAILPDVQEGVSTAISDEVLVLLAQPSQGFVLGDALDASVIDWPQRLAYLDYTEIAGALDRPLANEAVFVLQAGEPYARHYNYEPVADGPEKHYGYAFQWFAMLAALLALYIYLTFFKKYE